MLFEVPFSGKSPGLERKKKDKKVHRLRVRNPENWNRRVPHCLSRGIPETHTLPWWGPQISKGRVVGLLVPQATNPNSKSSSKPHEILWSLSSRVINIMTIHDSYCQ